MKGKFNKSEDAYIRQWSKKIKAISLLGGECEVCGCNSPILLDFHHKLDKDKMISRLLTYRWSLLEKEIGKCSLLCSNCHAEKHCDSKGKHTVMKKTWLQGIQKLVCEECGYKNNNLASLDFHHKSENKEFLLSDVFGRRVTVSVGSILEEMDKCEVLCRNCHRLRHFDIERFNLLKSKIIDRINTYREISLPLNRSIIENMYFVQGLRQSEIVSKLGCAKSTVSMILKELRSVV